MKHPREIDCLIQHHVFGNEVLGYTTCSYIEGDWDVYPNELPDRSNYTTLQPVYLNRCHCEDNFMLHDPPLYEEHEMFGGHIPSCLEVVPFYSSDIRQAWKALEIVLKNTHRNRDKDFSVFYQYLSRLYIMPESVAAYTICMTILKYYSIKT